MKRLLQILFFKVVPTFSILVISWFSANCQILFKNPSFEGEAQEAAVPVGWESCGNFTTPDILPGPWGVFTNPHDGNTFLGLICREDGTWEMVGQKLSQTLKKNECYHVSVALAGSTAYAGYNQPVRFRAWGGSSLCDKRQVLFESAPIDHHQWKVYDFYFFPNANYQYIILEPSYKNGGAYPYRGNILVDGLSNITACQRASKD